MAHNSWVMPFGTWPANTVVTHGMMAQLDAGQFAAVNGDSGGTWSPSSTIVIGGSGLNVSAPLIVNGTIHVTGAATFDGNVTLGDAFTDTLTVTATSTFSNPVTFSSTTAHSGNATFSNPVTFSNTTSHAGTASFAGSGSLGTTSGDTWTINATASFQTQPVFVAGVDIVGNSACLGDLSFTSSGSIVERVVIGADADTTYSVSTADVVFIPSTLTAPRVYQVDSVGAVNGKKMRFSIAVDSSSTVEVDLQQLGLTRRLTGGSTRRLKNTSTNYTSAEITFVAGAWQLTDFSGPN